MPPLEKLILDNQTLWLSTERCIYWEENQTLIVSDLHFGKTGHFRKSGIGVPQSIYKEDLQRLLVQLQHFRPKQLIVVGDFFHSIQNKELDFFLRWRNDFSHLKIHLVRGNHDILLNEWYEKATIEVADSTLRIDNFCFVHDINDLNSNFSEKMYYFSGHVHPGIQIKGVGKQSISLPCFYFSKHFAILPAFSRFTGYAMVNKKPLDAIYAIIPANISKGQHSSIITVK